MSLKAIEQERNTGFVTEEQMNRKILNHLTALAIDGEEFLEVNELNKQLLCHEGNPDKCHSKLSGKMDADKKRIKKEIEELKLMTNAVLNNPLTWIVRTITL